MSFSVYDNISSPETHTYKLMQLPKELVEYMGQGSGRLQFKAPAGSSSLVLCTDASTYTVRQMKHSNTQLLVNDMAVNGLQSQIRHITEAPMSRPLVAVGRSSYQYELSKTGGHVDTSGVPLYSGESVSGTRTVGDVMQDSPIADGAFFSAWHALGGCEVQGKAVILAPRFVSDVLYVLVSLLAQEKQPDFALDDVTTAAAAQNKRFTREVMSSVAHRFCTQTGGRFQLRSDAVATWFGTETLRAVSGSLPDKEFLLEWKSSLPPLFSASLDLKALRGRFYRPVSGAVQYIDDSLLSRDLHTRVKELFKIVGVWDYDEFLPLVLDLLPANKKPDSVILKYARKKRDGKRFVVCPR